MGSDIVGLNLLPLATEMRAWLTRKGKLSLAPEAGKGPNGGYYNPYSFSGRGLGLILSHIVNSWHDYISTKSSDDSAVDAEIERLRIYNEAVLYAARFCEVVIKQLLFCTGIPAKQYKNMALGGLLESPCPSCTRAKGMKPHSISMVGTLAHPFHLCLEFEHCAMDHMALVNTQRNTEAAHSDLQMLNIRTVAESKAHLAKDCEVVFSRLVHMLSHLEDLELSMIEDLTRQGREITRLKLDGLAVEHCNFDLVPRKPVVPISCSE